MDWRYRISKTKKAIARDMISNEGAWNFNFRRRLNENEIGNVADLLTQLGNFSNSLLDSTVDDAKLWSFGSNFSVSSCYTSLDLNGFLMFPVNKFGIQKYHSRYLFWYGLFVTKGLQL